MSNTDDTRERLERLIAAADRVAARPIPAAPEPRRWLPVAAATLVGLGAVAFGVHMASGGGRAGISTQTTSVPTVSPGAQPATSLPTVITFPPTSVPVIAPSTTVPDFVADPSHDVRWTTVENGVWVLHGSVPDQLTAATLVRAFSDAVGAANVRSEYVVANGAPQPPDERLLPQATLQFAPGAATLQADGILFVDALATLLQQQPGVTVDIGGYTDDLGTPEQNLVLSKARADAVQRRLVEDGVDAARVVATGFGDGFPVSEDGTPAGRARNQRIEFTLHHLLN